MNVQIAHKGIIPLMISREKWWRLWYKGDYYCFAPKVFNIDFMEM